MDMRSFWKVIGAMLVLGLAQVALAGEAGRLGYVVYRQAGAGRIHESMATLENDRAMIKTLDRTAIVHLDNGNVLRLAENSAVIFEGLPSGGVEVSVLSGKLTMLGSRGKLRTAGSGSFFLLGPVALDTESAVSTLDDAARPSTGRSR